MPAPFDTPAHFDTPAPSDKPAPFRKKKALGQNFLTNRRVCARIAEVSGADAASGVLEIGPGMGALTAELAARAAKVVAVEKDEELIPRLADRFSGASNVRIVGGDILSCNLNEIVQGDFRGLTPIVCANLPYYITTPVIMLLLKGAFGFRSITVTVQKEVAQRLAALPGSPQYGAVTAAVAYYAEVKKRFEIGAANFSPKPKVDSAVITMCPYAEKPVVPDNEKLFFAVIKAAFATRRKTLVNSLSAAFPAIGKGAIAEAAAKFHAPNVRGEELGVAEFAQISDELNKIAQTKITSDEQNKIL